MYTLNVCYNFVSMETGSSVETGIGPTAGDSLLSLPSPSSSSSCSSSCISISTSCGLPSVTFSTKTSSATPPSSSTTGGRVRVEVPSPARELRSLLPILFLEDPKNRHHSMLSPSVNGTKNGNQGYRVTMKSIMLQRLFWLNNDSTYLLWRCSCIDLILTLWTAIGSKRWSLTASLSCRERMWLKWDSWGCEHSSTCMISNNNSRTSLIQASEMQPPS